MLTKLTPYQEDYVREHEKAITRAVEKLKNSGEKVTEISVSVLTGISQKTISRNFAYLVDEIVETDL